ncbi:MAG: SulP family inorganic anion transporter, partial [Thermoanaerobaculia bacterium]
FFPALTLSILLSIDTLKTGIVVDALTRRRHNSNRELLAQGTANISSFLAGGIPGAGAMAPTAVNIASGGRSLWSGVIDGLFVLISMVALGRLVAWVPIAALAGILLVIAFRMFDFHMFRLITLPSTRLDFFVIASVVIVAETVGLIQATLVGVCLAILLFIRNQMRGTVVLRKSDLRATRSKRRRGPDQMELLEEHGAAAIIVQLKDDLFFGTTDQLFSDLEDDIAHRRFICLDFRRVQSMDYTAAQLLTQMQTRMRERGSQLIFCSMPSAIVSGQDIGHYLAQLGVTSEASGIRSFDTRDAALEWMEAQILEQAGWLETESQPPLGLAQVNLLSDLDESTLAELAPFVHELSLGAGDLVFKAGDTGDDMFFVRKGRIHILLPLEGGKRHHLATLGRGEFFGEMAFLDRHTRSADAEAACATELYVVSRASFDRLAEKCPSTLAVFEQLALAIAARLRLADAELRALEER